MKAIQASAFLMFDLDGTLSDPGVGISRSINYALERYGYAIRSHAEIAPYIGPPLVQAFSALTGCEDEDKLLMLVAAYRERYGRIGYAENTLYPGIKEALSSLAEHGIPLGVCTSKRTDFARRILDMFGLTAFFRFIDGGDIGIEKWQQIEGLKASGAIHSASIMVGDRHVDMEAAHRNGLHAVGVLWGYGSREELQAHEPEALLEHPTQLTTLIGNFRGDV